MIEYAVLDTETTGFSPRTGDRIVEIAVVQLDAAGAVQNQWETLLDPGRSVGPTHVHGLSAADVLGAPRFGEVADHVSALLAGRVVVGHNVAFDMRFLSAELIAAGHPDAAFPTLCTQRLAAQYLPGPKRTLAVCCEQAGIRNAHAHSALGDTLATAELFAFYLGHHPTGAPWTAQLKTALPTPRPAPLLSVPVRTRAALSSRP